jgi:hypothetical protein
MATGARVIDSLPINPWGDLDEFRKQVYGPIHGTAPAAPTLAGDQTSVFIDADDVARIKDVLDGLGESISGGVPWIAVTDEEREAVNRLVKQLEADAG